MSLRKRLPSYNAKCREWPRLEVMKPWLNYMHQIFKYWVIIRLYINLAHTCALHVLTHYNMCVCKYNYVINSWNDSNYFSPDRRFNKSSFNDSVVTIVDCWAYLIQENSSLEQLFTLTSVVYFWTCMQLSSTIYISKRFTKIALTSAKLPVYAVYFRRHKLIGLHYSFVCWIFVTVSILL